jgi:hypothetical protein
MTRYTNHGERSWSGTQDIPQAHRAPKLQEPVAKAFSKVGPAQHRVETKAGGYSVTWPAHVTVQQVPGMERPDSRLHVDPASVPVVDVRTWGKS